MRAELDGESRSEAELRQRLELRELYRRQAADLDDLREKQAIGTSV